VEEGIWENGIRKDTDKKNLGSCYRSQRNVQATKSKNLLSIQEWKREGSKACG